MRETNPTVRGRLRQAFANSGTPGSHVRHASKSAVVALLTATSALAACSEEDRRAWVSILPSVERGETVEEEGPSGPAALGADSTAVLLGADTLFTTADLPREAAAPDARFVELLFAPDSTRIAFRTTGARPAVGIWWRTRQAASVAGVFPGGTTGPLSWSADGRYLAYGGTRAGEAHRVGVFDTGQGIPSVHPVVAWHARHGRSARAAGWIDRGRLRVLVAAGADTTGGLPHVWELGGGSFVRESHPEPLARNAPPRAILPPGGVFSLDLIGDAAEETVALYQDADGVPGALLLEERGGAFRAVPTIPLLPAEAIGWPSWEEASGRVALFQVADLGGRPTLLLRFPSPDANATITGLYQAEPGGAVRPVAIQTPAGLGPAVFFEGPGRNGFTRLGLLDLDGGGYEVVTALAQRDPLGLPEDVEWTPSVWRWRDGRLVPAPDLAEEALTAIGRLTGGATAAEPAPGE